MNGRATRVVSCDRVWRKAAPPFHGGRSQGLPLDHRAHKPRFVVEPVVLVGTTGELLNGAQRIARLHVVDDPVLKQEVGERQTEAVWNLRDRPIFRGKLLFEPVIDPPSRETPLVAKLHSGQLLCLRQIQRRLLANVKVSRHLGESHQSIPGTAHVRETSPALGARPNVPDFGGKDHDSLHDGPPRP